MVSIGEVVYSGWLYNYRFTVNYLVTTSSTLPNATHTDRPKVTLATLGTLAMLGLHTVYTVWWGYVWF